MEFALGFTAGIGLCVFVALALVILKLVYRPRPTGQADDYSYPGDHDIWEQQA